MTNLYVLIKQDKITKNKNIMGIYHLTDGLNRKKELELLNNNHLIYLEGPFNVNIENDQFNIPPINPFYPKIQSPKLLNKPINLKGLNKIDKYFKPDYN